MAFPGPPWHNPPRHSILKGDPGMGQRSKSWVRIALCCIAVLALTSMVFGQEFWVKKDFKQWNQKEVEKMLNDSPWAKDVTVATSAPGGGGIDMGAGGGG